MAVDRTVVSPAVAIERLTVTIHCESTNKTMQRVIECVWDGGDVYHQVTLPTGRLEHEPFDGIPQAMEFVGSQIEDELSGELA